jgi:glycerophosphoryl diester phosphodiesterase
MKRDRHRWLTARPIAHRGYHDASRGRPENSLAAFEAAVAAHYAIECDLHASSDGVPFVFHDLYLERLTGDPRCIRALSASEIRGLRLADTAERIPTLDELLALVEGRVPLIIELKHVPGRDAGLAWTVAERLKHYAGPAALMSFARVQVAEARAANPHLPRGLTARGNVKRALRLHRAARHLEVDFVSYRASDLPTPMPILSRRLLGIPLISWTVRSPAEARKARIWADQITFEGFAP